VIRATLDVTVLASGFPAEAGAPSELIDHWTDLADALVISEHILEGLARTCRHQAREHPCRACSADQERTITRGLNHKLESVLQNLLLTSARSVLRFGHLRHDDPCCPTGRHGGRASEWRTRLSRFGLDSS
jgi:hypothetical protein